MKNIRKLILLLFALPLALSGCHDPFYDGTCVNILAIYNQTESDIVAVYEDLEQDSTCTFVFPKADTPDYYNTFYLGRYQGSKRDDYPPAAYINEKMQHVTIYRTVGDSIQYLPKSFYDSTEKFDVTLVTDFEHFITYTLSINESMFGD